MRRHPELARELLSASAYLRRALEIPEYHHEKWDGSGYPHGLRGERIPLAARAPAVPPGMERHAGAVAHHLRERSALRPAHHRPLPRPPDRRPARLRLNPTSRANPEKTANTGTATRDIDAHSSIWPVVGRSTEIPRGTKLLPLP